MDKWITAYLASVAASGGGESFEEYGRLCTDIQENMEASEEEMAELTRQ